MSNSIQCFGSLASQLLALERPADQLPRVGGFQSFTITRRTIRGFEAMLVN